MSRNLRKTGLSYLCIGYLISVLFSAVSNLVKQVSGLGRIEDAVFADWLRYLEGTVLNELAFFAGFAIPGICMIVYTLPLLRGKTGSIAERRIINIPSVSALLVLLGWVFNFCLQYGVALYAQLVEGQNFTAILIIFPLATVITAIPSITLTYLALEIFNRVAVLPRMFPDGNIFTVKGTEKPSLRFLFLMVFLAVCIYPIFEMTYYFIGKDFYTTNTISLSILIHPLLPITLSMAIMAILLRLIRKPLKLLSAAVGRVEQGDYTQGVQYVSNDEMGFLANGFNKMTASLAEKEFLRDTFGKVVDPKVRDYLTKGSVPLRGESREVTVLFCDIRSFTAMSEKLTAEEVVQFLNGYFSALGVCIARNNGVINKYIGDAIMAIFGAPVPSEKHAEDAFAAAVEMRAALAELNRQYAAEGKPPVRFGIGIHTGSVFAGTIGSRERMEYTIIGDTVNTASRIESLCKDYGTDILVSESTVSQLTSGGADSGGQSPAAGGPTSGSMPSMAGGLTSSGLISGGPRLSFVDDAHIRGKEQPIKVYKVGEGE